jgi:hypothetical protein
MKHNEIVRFARQQVEPITDSIGHLTYRCAAYLKDGVYLPCVALKSRRVWRELALKRLGQLQAEVETASLLRRRQDRSNYEAVVESFVIAGNRLNDYDIDRVELSRFAVAPLYLKALSSETSMGWTQFVVTMSNGRRFSFGTAFHIEFFQMPDGYSAADIVGVEPHLREHPEIFRERPFFTCFVEGL